MKLEPTEDRKPERARESYKNPIVSGPDGWYRQVAAKLLCSDLKVSVIPSNNLKSSEVTILRQWVFLRKKPTPRSFFQYTFTIYYKRPKTKDYHSRKHYYL